MAKSASQNWYTEERRVYKESFEVYICDEDVEKILKKLASHYGISEPRIEFRGKNQSGSAYFWRDLIRISHNPSMGLVVHEFGHILHNRVKICVNFRSGKHIGALHGTDCNNQFLIELAKLLEKTPKKGTDHHGLRFEKVLHNIQTYAQLKDLWRPLLQKWQDKREELIRKKRSKKVPEVLLKIKESVIGDEILAKKIQKTKEEIEKKEAAKSRYNKKLQYFQKLYGTKTKKANRSIVALRRALKRYEEIWR